MKCPVCGSCSAANLLELHCGNFDGSSLYEMVRVDCCEQCGHVYNRLLPEEIANLTKYYDDEYAPTNMAAKGKSGDGQRLSHSVPSDRYDLLYDELSKLIHADTRVLDIGCGTGDFMDYLHEKGMKHLSGIDPVHPFVNFAEKNGCYGVKIGCAESIPYEASSFDLLIMDQVLEHLVEPRLAFKEAKRVLTTGGLFCIGIPNAARYDRAYFFDFFWFLIREHIQHFDLDHLVQLAGMEGFELVCFREDDTALMSEKMVMPNLNVIFRLTGAKAANNKSFALKNEIEIYLGNECARLAGKKEIIQGWADSGIPIYAWGIGREFLYLYAAAGLNRCAVSALIDANLHKQHHCMIDGEKILSPAVLQDASPDSALLITAMAHLDAIRDGLDCLRYRGMIVKF